MTSEATQNDVSVIAFGASAGGLQCLRPIIRGLKPSAHQVYVVAVHLSPSHISNLTEILADQSAVKVVSASDDQVILPGYVYVCSSATDIVIVGGRIQLLEPSASALIAPSIDRLFSSIAHQYGHKAVAVVLSGSGHDCVLGAKDVNVAGGVVIVQNPEEAIHPSMPEAIINQGLADRVGGIKEIVAWLNDNEFIDMDLMSKVSMGEQAFSGLIKSVADATGLNATQYKENTLRRQIIRRYRNLGMDSLKDYLDYIHKNSDELRILHQAFLISVSAFFRDSGVFAVLRDVLSQQLAKLKSGDSFRVWVPGCATGEEPYSIAILLTELLDERLSEIDVRIFATDIDHRALDKARGGIYDAKCLESMPDERKAHWFVPHLGEWRITKKIRDLVVFSSHDVMLHPPFIKMDLISCRNLLIYFKPNQQADLIHTFHYSLNPDGLLLLGRSESVGLGSPLFDAIDTDCKLFRRLNATATYPVRQSGFRSSLILHQPHFPKAGVTPQKQTLVDTAIALLAKEFAPPAVLVNSNFEPIHFFGRARRYFSLQNDHVEFTVFALCVPSLRNELKALCFRLVQENLSSLEGVTVMVPYEGLDIAIKPILKRVSPIDENAEFSLLICFEESTPSYLPDISATRHVIPYAEEDIDILRQELADSREHLQSVIEAMETANEELQSLTEELQSSSEELQASNEELQSSNEELTTLNDELRAKSQEAIELNEVLSNIQNSIRTSLVLVDKDARISRFNELATRIFGLVSSDIGHPIDRVPCHLRLPKLMGQIEQVVSQRISIMERAHYKDFHYLMQIDPYINASNQVAGAVLAFSDISELLAAEQEKQTLERRFSKVWDSCLEGLVVVQSQGLIDMVNPAFAEMFGYQEQELIGQPIEVLVPDQYRIPHVKMREDFVANPEPGKMVHMRDILGRHRSGKEFYLEVSLSLMEMNGEQFALAAVSNITSRKTAEIALRQSEEQLRLSLDASHAGTWRWKVTTNENIWSDNLWSLYGISDRSIIPSFESWLDSIAPHDRDRAKNTVLMASSQSEEFEIEWQVNLPPEDSPRWLMARGRPVFASDGRVDYYHGLVLDITQRRRAEEEVKKYVSVFQNAGWGMVVVDPLSEKITHVNDAYAQMHGFETVELLGKPLIDTYAPSVRDHIPEQVRQTNLKGHHIFESMHLRKDGSEFPVLIDVTVYKDSNGNIIFRAATVEDITERKATEATLKMWGNAFEQAEFALAIGNPKTNHLVSVNPFFARQRGFTQEELVGRPVLSLFPPDRTDEVKTTIQQLDMNGHSIFESEHLRKDGSRFPVLLDITVTKSRDGQPQTRLAYAQDISERKRAEAELRLAASVFANTHEGVLVCDAKTIIIDVNPSFSRITGYLREEVIGKTPSLLASEKQSSDFYAEMYDSLTKRDFWRGEIWNRRKNGELYAEMLSISVVRDSGGQLSHYIGVFSDISQLKAHQEELDKIAHFDPLTGVPNRRLLTYRLDQSLAHARRTDTPLAVCYLDLDFFKPINDQHGHAIGDHLLIAIAERLKAILRAEDTLARLGGDEFILLLSDLIEQEEIYRILDRILEEVHQPVLIKDTVLQVSASIGVSVFPSDDSDADTLIRHADQAMYRAKQKGKNRYHFYDFDQDQKIRAHLERIQRLEAALNNQELILYYQPKVNLRTGEVFGVEALIRWQHPERGLLLPGEFLYYLYGSELETVVGEWVIETALNQTERWQQEGFNFTVSVNIGADHLLQSNFTLRLKNLLTQHPNVASNLEIEILETAALADMEHAIVVMNQCQEFGVGFSLDDFGTGYSSLAYFRKLPIQNIKIDQSFVKDMIKDANDFEIVESVIRLARAFKRPVIAEGVETLEHARMLLGLDCNLAQGYGISSPLPPDRLLDWLEEWQKNAIWKSLEI